LLSLLPFIFIVCICQNPDQSLHQIICCHTSLSVFLCGRIAGTSMQELARTFGLSRQTVERYLNTAAGDGCTMRITYMFRRQPCTVIDVDFLDQKVVIQNKTDDILHRAFGVLEHPTWNDFENFLRDRCFPQTRGNCKELLQEMELTDYDPLKIVEKTKGRLAGDEMWLRLRYLPRKEIIYASH